MRRLFPIVAVLGLFFGLYAACLAVFSFAGFPASPTDGRPMPYLADKPVGEDAYYMLTVAWNIASGKGVVYNFDRATTGIQPLSTFVDAGIAFLVRNAGGGRWMLVRMVLVFNAFLLVVFAFLLARIASSLVSAGDEPARRAAWLLGFAAALFNFTLFRLLTYGLETGLYLVLFALCVRMTLASPDGWTVRRAFAFGLLAGLAGLARIDFGIVLGIVLGALALSRRIRVRAALAAGAAALLVTSPWLVWVRSATGSWIPSSGGAQSALISAGTAGPRLLSMGFALVDHLTPWLYEAGKRGLFVVGFATLAALFLWLSRPRPGSAPPDPGLRARRFVASAWAGAALALCVVYAVFFWPLHFYLRYSSPVTVLVIPLLAAAAARRFSKSRPAFATAAVIGLVVCFFAAAAVSLHTGRIGNNLTVAAGVIAREFPPPAKVGMFQSGVTGFFNPNVVNLDGKIDPEALRHLRDKKTDAYIDREGIGVILDWPGYIDGNLPSGYLISRWKLIALDPLSGFARAYVRRND